MTSAAFVRRESREIVYAYGIGRSGAERFVVEWQKWIDKRDAVGRICVGRNLGDRYDSLDYLRARYSPGMGWEEVTIERSYEIGHEFQREGLEFPWKPPFAHTLSIPC